MSNLKIPSPVYPGNETAWIIDRSARISGPTCYPAVSGGESAIWLSLGKLLVNLLQVVKGTNTPLIPQPMIIVTIIILADAHIA